MQGNLVHIQEAVPTREHFLLPTLGPKLEKLGEEVRVGRGFQLLRCATETICCMQTSVRSCPAALKRSRRQKWASQHLEVRCTIFSSAL